MKNASHAKNRGFLIVWEFQVRRGRRRQFEKIYGSNGAWAKFFRKGRGYLGTELFRDAKAQLRYVTLDYWESPTAYKAFKRKHSAQYKLIDDQCEALTHREKLIGYFRSLLPPL